MTTSITATCACHAFTYTINFPNTSLPIPRSLCLCTSCRQAYGTSGISYIAIPSSQTISPSNFNVTTYQSSSFCTKYFCSTCGAHTFCYMNEPGTAPKTKVATGLWDRTEGIIKWEGCKWVEDTLDGGISVWFTDIVDVDGTKRSLKRWMLDDRGDKAEIAPESSLRVLKEKPRSETLKAECHCGGVKYYITRPNEASKKAQSPFSDLQVPFHLGSNANPENKTWWLRENDTKYLAGTCTCTSCRQNLGMEIQTWAFVPKCNIFKGNGSPLDFDIGTLKSYNSSEGVTRNFCGKCGATVFWHCDWRPDIIDVSVGLLDPEEGARIEGWLDWWPERVSFKEMAVSKSLITSLEDGVKKWGRSRDAEIILV